MLLKGKDVMNSIHNFNSDEGIFSSYVMIYISVVSMPGHNCRLNRYPLTLDQPHGYLSSHVTYSTSCGSQYSPWIIQGQPGQRINLTLFDYSTRGSEGENTGAVTCHNYAMFTGEQIWFDLKWFDLIGFDLIWFDSLWFDSIRFG